MRERERGGLRRGRERGEVREHQNEPHTGSFWCLRRGRGRGEVCEHQKVPTWALSGVQNERGEEGTPERALVGTFWWSGCGDVFGGWGTSRVSCGRQEWRVSAFSMEG